MIRKVTSRQQLYLLITVLLSTLLIFGVVAPLFSQEKPDKPVTVSVLMSGESRRERLAGLQHGLEELGFHEGKQIKFHVVSAGENRQRLGVLAQELVKSNSAVIVVLGGLEADAVQQAELAWQQKTGQSIPVVLAGVASVIARGLQYNNRQPQLTGVENLDAELTGKRLEYVTLLLPQAKRVGIVYEPGIIPSEQGLLIAQQVAPHLGLEILEFPVRSGDDLLALETLLSPSSCDGLLLMPSFIIESAVKTFYRLSVHHKIPVFGLRVTDASANYFASFGPNVYHQGRQAARLVAKILKHTPVDQIPIETPDRVELVINLDIARQTDIPLTPEQLHYADHLAGRGAP